MAKRVLLVAIIVVAVLVVAAPAMAFNGFRADYDVSTACAVCHADGAGGAPAVYDLWSETGHAKAGSEGQANRMPYGSSCAGCHTANYNPSKVVPTPTATATTGAVSWGAVNGTATEPQATGTAASSESAVGCSSCHYNQTAAHAGTGANPSNLANGAICGQCHSRYSYTVNTYTVAPVPYVKVTDGSPVPNPSPTTLLQPQYAIGFETMGNAANGWTPAALGTNLNLPTPGWTPAPNPSATAAAGLMHYWQVGGEDTEWQYNGHDGSASQYPEWAISGHAKALETLKAAVGPNPPAECLECHSSDYVIAPDDAKPTGAEAKYGVTCVGCHTPHEKGTATGIWSEEWTPQLRTDSQRTVCSQCHTAQLNGKVAKAGSEIFDTTTEMLNGTGAIGVPQGSPGVHKGKCVQCHMPPTSSSPTGANHTFKLILPVVAAEAVVPHVTATPLPKMPYSACSTCHSRPGDQAATWLQHTIDDRQAAMKAWDAQVAEALTKAAKKLGYKDTAAANKAINKIKMNKWTKGQKAFQQSFTNQMFIEAEGSMGIHNWDYARIVILKALEQARSVKK